MKFEDLILGALLGLRFYMLLSRLLRLLLLSKIDINQDDLIEQNLPSDVDVIYISSITEKNLEKAIQSIAYLLDK